MNPIQQLFSSELKVINIGLSSFGENLKESKVRVVSLNWAPPAGGNRELLEYIEKYKEMIQEENRSGMGDYNEL